MVNSEVERSLVCVEVRGDVKERRWQVGQGVNVFKSEKVDDRPKEDGR